MQTKSFTAFPFPLTRVVSEIAEKLIANDWMRCATADDSSHYFIVGVEAQRRDDTGGEDHPSLGVPGTPSVTPLGQSQVDAQVAATRASDYYLRKPIAKLVALGIDRERLQRFASGNFDDLTFLHGQLGAPERFEAFSELTEAMLLARGLELELSEAERRAQVDAAVQKIYLKELAQLYKGVISRAASLEALTFSDSQLNEASRCYLYGFFRASVVLCGATLEQNLKAALRTAAPDHSWTASPAGDDRPARGYFNQLVDQADGLGRFGPRDKPGVEPALTQYARRVFEQRTAVVHNGHIPLSGEAEELLTKTREVVEFLRSSRSKETA